ncbi:MULTISPECIES: hypothetical protein [Rheinheimera]|uniref:50S ribosomal protein L18 n=1 Tax=Rheinheimera marina TaxID=1774958 RepID=A0ABV9JPP6_9GAMM
MLKRKKPKMMRKRRLIDVASGRRRIARNMTILKLHRRRRNYLALLVEPQTSEAIA